MLEQIFKHQYDLKQILVIYANKQMNYLGKVGFSSLTTC
jgi:hypothetical protein